MCDKLRAQRDQRPSHDQCPHNAPFQKAVLQPFIHGKRAENHQEKEQVVDAESLFDQIAREKFQCQLLAIKIEHSESKEDGDRDPAKTRKRRLANLDLVGSPVEYTKVQRDRNGDEEVERSNLEGRSHSRARMALGSRAVRVDGV